MAEASLSSAKTVPRLENSMFVVNTIDLRSSRRRREHRLLHPTGPTGHQDRRRQARVHPKVMQELAGHAISAVTMGIYAHVNKDSKREAAETLAKAIAAVQRQSLYLRFLYLKRAVCPGFWEFDACFRFEISEVRGKLGSGEHTPVLCFGDLRFC